jgi:hypothetical protein
MEGGEESVAVCDQWALKRYLEGHVCADRVAANFKFSDSFCAVFGVDRVEQGEFVCNLRGKVDVIVRGLKRKIGIYLLGMGIQEHDFGALGQ